jgi:hypothetical protein
MVLLGAFVTYASAAYRSVWRLALAAGVLLSTWWLGVALYAFYDFLLPEQPSAPGGRGLAQVGGPLFFIVACSTWILMSLGKAQAPLESTAEVH